MSEPFYIARATLAQLGSLHRRAALAAGGAADFGVHGPVRELYDLHPERELPLPVDYIVTAAGG